MSATAAGRGSNCVRQVPGGGAGRRLRRRCRDHHTGHSGRNSYDRTLPVCVKRITILRFLSSGGDFGVNTSRYAVRVPKVCIFIIADNFERSGHPEDIRIVDFECADREKPPEWTSRACFPKILGKSAKRVSQLFHPLRSRRGDCIGFWQLLVPAICALIVILRVIGRQKHAQKVCITDFLILNHYRPSKSLA